MATTPPDEPRLSVRVPQELHDRIRERAEAENRTVSSYVRLHLMQTIPAGKRAAR